jgi:O-antigen/teichoic acid export membrane protein
LIGEWISRFRNSEYVSNILTLSTGTTIAQVVAILTAPILYRIYTKEDYGTLGLYIAISTVLASFSTLNYTEAILIERSEDDAKVLLWLNRYLNLGVAILSFILVLVFGSVVSEVLGNPMVKGWLYLIPVSLFFGGQNYIFRVWANRRKEYKLIAINGIVNALSIPLVSISVGVFVLGPLGLFAGLIISQVVPSLILVSFLSRKEDLRTGAWKSWGRMRETIKRYQAFPKYGVPAALLGRLSHQMPVLFISSFLGPAVVGLYNLGVRLLGLPAQVIGEAVAEVYRKRATEDIQDGSFRPIFKKTLQTLLGLSVVPVIVLLLFGPDLFAFVFGQEWEDAGYIAQVLLLLYLCKFLLTPLNYSFILRQRLKEDLAYQFLIVLVSGLVLYFGLLLGYSYLTVLLYFAVSSSLIYIFYIYRSYLLAKTI